MRNNAVSRQGKQSGSGSNYWIFIHRLPTFVTWKDLKDEARNIVAQEPGFVQVYHLPNGASEECGSIPVKRRQAADKLFEVFANKLWDGRRLAVHYFDITNQAILLGCNCASIFNSEGHMSGAPIPGITTNDSRITGVEFLPQAAPFLPSPYQQAIDGADPRIHVPVVPASASYNSSGQPAMAARYNAMQPGYVYPTDDLSDRTAAMSIAGPNQDFNSAASYGTGRDVAQIEQGRGTVRVEARGIFISNLPFHVSKRELEGLLKQAGRLEDVKILQNAEGKPKGSATARFATAQEAERAVQLFDQKSMRGRSLQVRYDKNKTPVGPSREADHRRQEGSVDFQEPLVVNGSSTGPAAN